jgi:acetyl-CoA carboxylase biotin carboxylase subunit
MNSIFIADRGEIAVRIGRACSEMGIRTVQAYSEPDRESLAVRLADAAVCVGAGPSKDSYLNHAALITAAKMSGADAVHPGYGFLSENAEFAERCEAAGLTFIGPQASIIRLMGDKALARMRRALAVYRIDGVPTTLGFHRRLMQEPDFIAGNVHARYVRETMWAGHHSQGMV